MTKKLRVYSSVVLLGIVLAVVLYVVRVHTNDPIVFSEKKALSYVWNNYKKEYLEQGTGRPLDKQQNNITTSEGVSYTLLRAVWMDDKETFDQTLSWANDNLKRPNDSLYSWLFGKRPDGSYGVMIEQGGRNTASDADTDVALALVFASERFGDSSYLVLAKNMIGDIWDHEVVTIRGVPYLAANDLEKDAQGRIIINPSYFAPYAYKIFATVDSSHPWTALVDSSYALLTKATTANLDTGSTAGLPPDWITLSKKTGNIIPNESPHITTNFSYDALRVLWRVGLDYAWFKEPRAKEYLSQVTFLDNTWKSTNNLDAIYSHDGKSIIAHEAPALYGASLGYFMVYDKKTADDIYHHKLLALYNPDISAWKKPLSYYDDNWAWFGMALYKNFLPNLAIQ